MSNRNPQKLTIFGGGLIGSAAALSLNNAGHDVQVVTRAPPLRAFDTQKWIFGDLGSVEVPIVVAGAQTVIFSAGSMVPGSQIVSVAATLAEQVYPVVDLAEKAAHAGVSNFVFISSGGTVYGAGDVLPFCENHATNPINAYGMVKVQTEQALLEVSRRTGIAVHILRVANPYGPGQTGSRKLGFIAAAIDAALKGLPLRIWGDGSASRDFVFIDDVGRAIQLATESSHPGGIFNVGSGRETTLLHVCEIVERMTRRQLNVEFEPARSVDVPRNVLDITRAREILDWRPEIDLEHGISMTVGR